MAKYCVNCGTLLENNAKFCTACGAMLQSDDNTVTKGSLFFKATKELFQKRKWLLPGTIGIALIIILIIALSSSGGNGVFGDRGRTASLSMEEYVNGYNEALRSTVSDENINTQVSDSTYVKCAKTLINERLKNPHSAIYNEAVVYEKDDYGRAIVALDISAENSFGGYVRSQFLVCIKRVNNDETFAYNPSYYYVEENTPTALLLLETMNDFGVDPIDVQLKGRILDAAAFTLIESVFLSDIEAVDCHSYNDTALSYSIYTDSAESTVRAVRFALNPIESNLTNSEIQTTLEAIASAISGESMTQSGDVIAKILNTVNWTPKENASVYQNGLVYDCAYADTGAIVFCVTIADKADYNKGLHWTPNHSDAYFENIADQFMAQENYDAAITYYEQSSGVGSTSEKLPEAYYKKAEDALSNGDFTTASEYFLWAGNYSDAAVRVLEVSYQAGMKCLDNEDYLGAIDSFTTAGSYSDATTKLKESCYMQGDAYLATKEYENAVECFNNAADFKDAGDRYKEASYLCGEKYLTMDQPYEAASYFRQAGDYLDASERVLKYHYEKGIAASQKKEYLSAADLFTSANGYQDSSEKAKECYYEYGKEQIELGYLADGITYLEMCPGYKDSDEILGEYYYGQAKAAMDTYFAAIQSSGNADPEQCCMEAQALLEKCGGYTDASSLLAMVKAVEELRLSSIQAKEMLANGHGGYYGYSGACIEYFTVTYDSESIYLEDSNVDQGTSANALITTTIERNAFSAQVEGIFERVPWGTESVNIIRSIVAMFTQHYNDAELQAYLQTSENWVDNENGRALSIRYGGLNITIVATEQNYGYVQLTISASK